MVKRIKLPDGSVAEFGDDIPDEQISQALSQQFPSQEAPPANINPSALPEQVRNRRATGDQSQPLPVEGQEADPLASVPIEISGVSLSPAIRKAILLGRSLEDPKQKRLLAARIAGRISAQSEGGNAADKLARTQAGALVRSVGAGLFGIGDVAAAGGTSLRGLGDPNAMSFGEALEAQREFRRAQEEEFPITTGIGEVGGALVGGGAALKGVHLLAKGTKAAPAVAALTTFKEGEKLANVGRAALAGGTGGAITEGVTEAQPLRGAEIGILGGPAGLLLAKTLGVTFDVLKLGISKAANTIGAKEVAEFIRDPAAKGLAALAKILGIPEKEMSRRFLEFKTVTGRNPAVADIANDQAAIELRTIIASSSTASQIAREEAEAALKGRGREVAEQIAGGRVTTTQIAEKARRGRVAEEQFAKADGDKIVFEPKDVADLLSDPDLRRAIPPTLKRRLDDILADVSEGGSATLTGLDVNDLRKVLRDRGKGATGADRVFLELADEVEDIARSQSPNFARAIDEFAARSVRGEGVQAGRKAITQPTSEFGATLEDVGEAGFTAGARVGMRSGLVDAARESTNASARLAGQLAENSGLVQRLRAVLKPEEVDRLQKLGRLQLQSIQNIGKLAPSAKVNTDLQAAVSDAVNATVLASTGTSAASKVFAFGRILKNLGTGLDNRVIENMAKDAFDPKKTKQLVTMLRKSDLSEDKILDLFAVSSAGGSLAASAVGEQ